MNHQEYLDAGFIVYSIAVNKIGCEVRIQRNNGPIIRVGFEPGNVEAGIARAIKEAQTP